MRLKVKRFNGRARGTHDVIDEDTGLDVGSVYCDGVGFVGGREMMGTGEINVSLYGGKYSTTVHRYEECLAFIEGVESVLRRMTALTDSAEYYLPGYRKDASAA